MRGAVDVVEFDSTVDGGEEGAVEPTTTLRDQLGNLGCVSYVLSGVRSMLYLIRNISDRIRRLDIVQDPGSTPFGNKFPTKNLISLDECRFTCLRYRHTYTILSQIHVCRKNVRGSTMLSLM